MDEHTRRLIDNAANGGKLRELLKHSGSQDDDTRTYSLRQLIRHYAARKDYGELMHFCSSPRYPEEIKVEAGMKLIGMARALNPSSKEARDCLVGAERLPPGEGILEDLALRRAFPEKVREAAAIKLVELLAGIGMRGGLGEFAHAKAKLEFIAECERFTGSARSQALNELDTLGLMARHLRDQKSMRKGVAPEGRGPGTVTPIFSRGRQ